MEMKKSIEKITDTRDGNTYRIVTIEKQIWMAENLRYKSEGSLCLNDNSHHYEKYGRLYSWNAAMKACPTGWHLPSESEFETLFLNVGGFRREEELKNVIDNQSFRDIYEHLFHQIYTQYLDTYRITIREQYINLLHRCPQIVQQINLKDIASFLRVTPTTISNIRREITFES